MLSLAVLAFLLSLVLTLVVRRVLRRRAGRYPKDAPQRFHMGYVPRLGGVGVLAAWALALAALPVLRLTALAGNIDGSRIPLCRWGRCPCCSGRSWRATSTRRAFTCPAGA